MTRSKKYVKALLYKHWMSADAIHDDDDIVEVLRRRYWKTFFWPDKKLASVFVIIIIISIGILYTSYSNTKCYPVTQREHYPAWWQTLFCGHRDRWQFSALVLNTPPYIHLKFMCMRAYIRMVYEYTIHVVYDSRERQQTRNLRDFILSSFGPHGHNNCATHVQQTMHSICKAWDSETEIRVGIDTPVNTFTSKNIRMPVYAKWILAITVH
jgi:hypothetical protein